MKGWSPRGGSIPVSVLFRAGLYRMWVAQVKGSAPPHSELGRYPSEHPLVTFHGLTQRLANGRHDFAYY
jgi:hypothetical protein